MKTLTPVLVLLFVSACGPSRAGLRSVPAQAGEERLFAGDVRAAVLATRDALAATPMKIIEAQERGADSWYLIAHEPDGAHVRVLCEHVAEGVVAIRIVVEGPITGRDDWGPTLFALLSLELDVAP